MTRSREGIADIALEFAKECMGWEDVTNASQSGRVYPKVCWSPARVLDLRFTDLNIVTEAARGWCDKHEQNLDVYYVPAPTGLWHVSAGTDPVEHADLCHAMLAACLAASKKLKTAP